MEMVDYMFWSSSCWKQLPQLQPSHPNSRQEKSGRGKYCLCPPFFWQNKVFPKISRSDLLDSLVSHILPAAKKPGKLDQWWFITRVWAPWESLYPPHRLLERMKWNDPSGTVGPVPAKQQVFRDHGVPQPSFLLLFLSTQIREYLDSCLTTCIRRNKSKSDEKCNLK